MAFVFKSSKDLDKPIQKENNILYSERIYKIKRNESKKNTSNISQSLNNSSIISIKPPIKIRPSAFGSDEKRDFLHLNKNQSPGPGSYDLDYNFIKKSFNKNINSEEDEDLNENNKNFNLGQNKLKLFISKEERFKNNIINNNPGPGKYELIQFPKIKTGFNNRNFGIKKSKSYLANSANRMISIPSKGNNFGYIIDENGEKRLDKDPNIKNNYNNQKDNVGPGSYDIKIPKVSKSVIDWEKHSDGDKKNKIKEEFVNKLDIAISELNTNRNKYSYFNGVETEPQNNNNYTSMLNTQDTNRNINYSLPNENIKMNNNIEKDTKNDKNNLINFDNLPKRKNINFDYLRMLNDEYYYTNRLKRHLANKPSIPGPGQYNFFDEFEIIANFSKCDNFGSSNSRGLLYPIKENKMKIGFDNKKNKKLKLNIHSSSTENISKKIIDDNSNQKNHKKLNKNKSVKNSLLKNFLQNYKLIAEKQKSKYNYENYNFSNNYEFSDKKNFKKSSSKVEHFGSLEKRFPEMSKSEVTPGVGTYSLMGNIENIKNKYKSNSPYNIVIQNLSKSKKISNEIKNKIFILNHKSPPIGLYSPEIKNCIKNDCEKKYLLNSGRKTGFSNEEKRFFKMDNEKDYYNDVGRYNLIKEEKEIKQQKAPFAFGQEKYKGINMFNYNIGNADNERLGPGAYRYDSYFDWNKKSFNVDFI